MILSCFIILLITFGGTALTYLYEKEDVLLARLAAGSIIGSAIFATAGFLLACLFGFSAPTILVALVITLLPLILLKRKNIKHELWHDWQKAKGKTQGGNFKKVLKFAYYVGIFLVLWFFFERAMIETKDGIFTGGSQNLGDLPFHLGAIFSFTEGHNFPPENPSFAGAKFTYPFLADLIVACFAKLGAGVREAMFAQNVFLSCSLVVLLEKFTVKLTGNRLAGKIAPVLLLFSGGLGFVWFFKDYWQGSAGFFEILRDLPRDYTISDKFRWGNSLVVIFLTQRSLLFGMPLTLIALTKIWEIFKAKMPDEEEFNRDQQDNKIISFSPFLPFFPSFLVGLLAGTLPLIHVHSLAVLFIVCAFLFFFKTEEKWREWVAFAAGVAIIAVPELIWSLTGSATNLSKFIGWHFGWDSAGQNFFVFWAKNIGLFAPLLLAGLYLIFAKRHNRIEEKQRTNDQEHWTKLLLFYIPFAFLFLISNTLKLAPWEWDNIKVLIYWFVASLPFVAFVLAWLWENKGVFQIVAAVCLIILTLSGMLDVWRTISGQINYEVFSRDAVRIAEQIKQKTPPNALFLNAPLYNSAVVLSGRRSLMRYSGHLFSYGIDYTSREDEVKRIYEGTALADRFLQKNNIEYVIISPEVRGYARDKNSFFVLNEEFFNKFPVVAEAGDYKVFKVK